MTASDAADLVALRDAIRQNPADRDVWLVYADALEDAGDARAELVRLMARRGHSLSRDESKRLAHLRGTVPLLSSEAAVEVERMVADWRDQRTPGDVAALREILYRECHPLIIGWDDGGDLPDYVARRLNVKRNRGGGDRWTWSGNDGQGGGGGYPTRAEAIVAALAAMSHESRASLRWIDRF